MRGQGYAKASIAGVDALVMPGGLKPREKRVAVSVSARLCRDNSWIDIRTRDISSRGLKVMASSPLLRGTYVEIRRARHMIIGRVVWAKDCLAGIQAQGILDVPAIVAGTSRPGLDGAQRPSPIHARYAARRSSTAERLERSRRASSALQFGFLVSLGSAAAMLAASTVVETLSRPLTVISTNLEAG